MQTPESNIVNEPFIEPPFPPQLPPEQNEVKRWRKKQSFYFHGKASEYFGIWIVSISSVSTDSIEGSALKPGSSKFNECINSSLRGFFRNIVIQTVRQDNDATR